MPETRRKVNSFTDHRPFICYPRPWCEQLALLLEVVVDDNMITVDMRVSEAIERLHNFGKGDWKR